MSKPDLDAIEARAKAATPGPYDVADDGGRNCHVRAPGIGARTGYMDTLAYMNTSVACKAEAELFAHAREDVPALVAYARELEEKLEASEFFPLLHMQESRDEAWRERDAALARVRELEAEVTSLDQECAEHTRDFGRCADERDAAIARAEQAERERDVERVAKEVVIDKLAEVTAQAAAMRAAVVDGRDHVSMVMECIIDLALGNTKMHVENAASAMRRALAPDAGRALLAESRRWHLPDGTFEELDPVEVVARRKAAAHELAELRNDRARAADILARGDACARELEDAAQELAALRVVAEAARQFGLATPELNAAFIQLDALKAEPR